MCVFSRFLVLVWSFFSVAIRIPRFFFLFFFSSFCTRAHMLFLRCGLAEMRSKIERFRTRIVPFLPSIISELEFRGIAFPYASIFEEKKMRFQASNVNNADSLDDFIDSLHHLEMVFIVCPIFCICFSLLLLPLCFSPHCICYPV